MTDELSGSPYISSESAKGTISKETVITYDVEERKDREGRIEGGGRLRRG